MDPAGLQNGAGRGYIDVTGLGQAVGGRRDGAREFALVKGEKVARWLVTVPRLQRAIDVLKDDARLIVVAPVYEASLLSEHSRP